MRQNIWQLNRRILESESKLEETQKALNEAGRVFDEAYDGIRDILRKLRDGGRPARVFVEGRIYSLEQVEDSETLCSVDALHWSEVDGTLSDISIEKLKADRDREKTDAEQLATVADL